MFLFLDIYFSSVFGTRSWNVFLGEGTFEVKWAQMLQSDTLASWCGGATQQEAPLVLIWLYVLCVCAHSWMSQCLLAWLAELPHFPFIFEASGVCRNTLTLGRTECLTCFSKPKFQPTSVNFQVIEIPFLSSPITVRF